MNLLEWTKKNCPHFIKTFERSQIPFETLKIGTKLMALRGGYSGGSGVRRKVVSEIKEERWGRFVHVAPLNYKEGDQVQILTELSKRDGHWSSHFIIIPDFKIFDKMNGHDERAWEIENIGCTLDDYNARAYHVADYS